MRKQVVIIGGGPSGLLLCRLLRLQGIDALVLEAKSRNHVENRIRAGVLEEGTVELLRQAKVSERMNRLGLSHQGFSLAFAGRQQRIDLTALTGGKKVTVYGQTDITRDLYAALLTDDPDSVIFETQDVEITGFLDGRGKVGYRLDGRRHKLECEFIAGCDGYHGISRRSIPAHLIKSFEKIYPFAWLGLLSDTPPVDQELIYVNHDRGFALCSQRSTERSRYYIQCDAADNLERWSEQAFWDELKRRIPPQQADTLITGPALEMGIAPLRSFVAEPMRFGALFLVGDAAHIVPPTGAKGLNLAASDVYYLARALCAYFQDKRGDLLESYSDLCLSRVWKAVRFSWWFTAITHRFENTELEHRIQLAELDYITASKAGQTTIAENYVGLPYGEFD